MARSSKQFYNYALEKWDNLHEAEQYSVNASEGTTAIVYADRIGDPSSMDTDINQYILERLAQEAERIKRRTNDMGAKALLLNGITTDSFARVLDDEQISDVVVIGNGSFSAVYDDDTPQDAERYDMIDWRDVADMTIHLKTGTFTQRTCARFKNNASVSPPFSTFLMADHRNIMSPVNELFCPDDIEYGSARYAAEEAKIRRVSAVRRIDLAYAQRSYRDN